MDENRRTQPGRSDQGVWLDSELPRPQLTVGFILTPDFTLNAFAGFVDALRLAADLGGRSRQILCGWRIMSHSSSVVVSSSGIGLTPGTSLEAPTEFDYIAVCGGNSFHPSNTDKKLISYLKEASRAGVALLGICTGSFELARAGLMRSREACVHWNVLESYRTQFSNHRARADSLFIEDGPIITCAGSAGAVDLALHLIARHLGVSKSHQSMRHLMVTSMRPPTFPQAQFLTVDSEISDGRVRRALSFIETHLDLGIRVSDIASYMGVSGRQIERLFVATLGKSPSVVLREVRIKYACWLLSYSDESISSIAVACGYSDSAHLARQFKQAIGKTPSEYRTESRRHPLTHDDVTSRDAG